MTNRTTGIGFWHSVFPNQLGNLCFVVFLAGLALFLLHWMFDLNVFDPDSFHSAKSARSSDEAPVIPELGTRRVVDEAGILTPEEISALTGRIDAFEAESGAQMAVLLIRSLHDIPLEDFSMDVATKWKIGRKGESNGVVLLLVIDDHRDRLEIGDGMEAVINDARAGDILRGMEPALKQEHYAQAISYAIESVTAFVRNEPAPEAPEGGPDGPADPLVIVLTVGLFAIVVGTFTARAMIHPDVRKSIGLIVMIFLGRLLLEALIAALRNGGRGGGGGGRGGGGRSGGGGGSFSGGGASGRW